MNNQLNSVFSRLLRTSCSSNSL